MTDGWPERQRRHAVDLDATVVGSCGSATDTKVVDLSLDGCKLAGEYRIGDRIQVTMQRIGMLMAVVRWSLQNHSGARFIRSRDGSEQTPC
jgi:hypothetical protein